MNCYVCATSDIGPDRSPSGGYLCTRRHLQCARCNSKYEGRCGLCKGPTKFLKMVFEQQTESQVHSSRAATPAPRPPKPQSTLRETKQPFRCTCKPEPSKARLFAKIEQPSLSFYRQSPACSNGGSTTSGGTDQPEYEIVRNVVMTDTARRNGLHDKKKNLSDSLSELEIPLSPTCPYLKYANVELRCISTRALARDEMSQSGIEERTKERSVQTAFKDQYKPPDNQVSRSIPRREVRLDNCTQTTFRDDHYQSQIKDISEDRSQIGGQLEKATQTVPTDQPQLQAKENRKIQSGFGQVRNDKQKSQTRKIRKGTESELVLDVASVKNNGVSNCIPSKETAANLTPPPVWHVLRTPVKCPACKHAVFVSDFSSHLKRLHRELPMDDIAPSVCKKLYFDTLRSKNCELTLHMIYFSSHKKTDLRCREYRNLLPIILLSSRIVIGKGSPDSVSSAESQNETSSVTEYLIFWVTGLEPEMSPILIHLTVGTRSGLQRSIYTGKMYPIREPQNPVTVFTSGQRIILSSHELQVWTNNYKESLELQVAVE